MATYSAGNPERARQVGEESVTRARRLGDDMVLGMSLRAYLLAVDPAESAALYAEALACTERAGDLGTNAALHNNAGNACLARGDFDGARAHLQTAIEAADASGHPSPTARGNLGCVLRAQGDLDGALSMFQDALRLSRRVGDNRSKAFIVHGLALLAGDRDDWQRAAMLHGAAQALLDKTGHPWESAHARSRSAGGDKAVGAGPPLRSLPRYRNIRKREVRGRCTEAVGAAGLAARDPRHFAPDRR
jgi:tetratricopeptide (TPR) repeat protein